MEVQNIQRFDNVNAIIVTQILVCDFAHSGIHVNWIDCLHIRMFIHYTADCLKHMTHWLTKVLAAMGSNHDQTAVLCPFQFRVSIGFPHGGLQSINSRVAGNVDAGWIFALFQQILLRKLCRSKVEFTDNGNRLTVELLWIRAINIVGAQTSFYMTYRNLHIEASQCSHEGRGCIAVNQYYIRFFLFQNSLDAIQNIGSYVEQRLLILHDGQVIIRGNIKCLKNHIKHLTMLTSHTNNRFQFFTFLQFINKRTHFNCFRTSTENEHYFFHIQYSAFLLLECF